MIVSRSREPSRSISISCLEYAVPRAGSNAGSASAVDLKPTALVLSSPSGSIQSEHCFWPSWTVAGLHAAGQRSSNTMPSTIRVGSHDAASQSPPTGYAATG